MHRAAKRQAEALRKRATAPRSDQQALLLFNRHFDRVALLRRERMPLMQWFATQLRQQGYDVSANVYRAMTQACAKQDMVDAVLQLRREATAAGVIFDQQTASATLACLARNGRFDELVTVLKRVAPQMGPSDQGIVTTAIRELRLGGHRAAARALWERTVHLVSPRRAITQRVALCADVAEVFQLCTTLALLPDGVVPPGAPASPSPSALPGGGTAATSGADPDEPKEEVGDGPMRRRTTMPPTTRRGGDGGPGGTVGRPANDALATLLVGIHNENAAAAGGGGTPGAAAAREHTDAKDALLFTLDTVALGRHRAHRDIRCDALLWVAVLEVCARDAAWRESAWVVQVVLPALNVALDQQHFAAVLKAYAAAYRGGATKNRGSGGADGGGVGNGGAAAQRGGNGGDPPAMKHIVSLLAAALEFDAGEVTAVREGCGECGRSEGGNAACIACVAANIRDRLARPLPLGGRLGGGQEVVIGLLQGCVGSWGVVSGRGERGGEDVRTAAAPPLPIPEDLAHVAEAVALGALANPVLKCGQIVPLLQRVYLAQGHQVRAAAARALCAAHDVDAPWWVLYNAFLAGAVVACADVEKIMNWLLRAGYHDDAWAAWRAARQRTMIPLPSEVRNPDAADAAGGSGVVHASVLCHVMALRVVSATCVALRDHRACAVGSPELHQWVTEAHGVYGTAVRLVDAGGFKPRTAADLTDAAQAAFLAVLAAAGDARGARSFATRKLRNTESEEALFHVHRLQYQGSRGYSRSAGSRVSAA